MSYQKRIYGTRKGFKLVGISDVVFTDDQKYGVHFSSSSLFFYCDLEKSKNNCLTIRGAVCVCVCARASRSSPFPWSQNSRTLVEFDGIGRGQGEEMWKDIYGILLYLFARTHGIHERVRAMLERNFENLVIVVPTREVKSKWSTFVRVWLKVRLTKFHVTRARTREEMRSSRGPFRVRPTRAHTYLRDANFLNFVELDCSVCERILWRTNKKLGHNIFRASARTIPYTVLTYI